MDDTDVLSKLQDIVEKTLTQWGRLRQTCADDNEYEVELDKLLQALPKFDPSSVAIRSNHSIAHTQDELIYHSPSWDVYRSNRNKMSFEEKMFPLHQLKEMSDYTAAKLTNYIQLRKELQSSLSTANLYNPSQFIYSFAIYNPRNLIKEQIIELKSNQTLEQLHEAIYCPFKHLSINAAHQYNAFFYIDQKFYVDQTNDKVIHPELLENIHQIMKLKMKTSSTNSVTQDTSAFIPVDLESIITRKKRKPSSFAMHANMILQQQRVNHQSLESIPQSAQSIHSMNRIQCSEIPSLAIGKKYLYCHHGCCEHFLYLIDITMECTLSAGAVIYPWTSYQRDYKFKLCEICEFYSAKFIVFGDRLVENSPTYFCSQCHYQLHYKKDGHIIYDDYHIFPYIHDS